MAESEILISIIIPVYNSENSIRNVISSLQKQRLQEIEIIVVDDCSTDNTIDVLQELSAEDKRIIWVQQESNQGPGSARNEGIKRARGNYLAFVDADDWVEVDFCSSMYSVIEKTQADVVICGYFQDVLDKNNSLINSKQIVINQEKINSDIGILSAELDINKMFAFPVNKLYKREIINSHQIIFSNKRFGEDFDFNVRYFQFVNLAQVIDKPLYHYIKRNEETLTQRYISDFYSIICDRYKRMKTLIETKAEDKDTAHAMEAAVQIKHIIAYLVRNCDKRAELNIFKRNKIIKDILKSPVYSELIVKTNKRKRNSYVKIFRTGNSIIIQIFARIVYLVQQYFRIIFEKIK